MISGPPFLVENYAQYVTGVMRRRVLDNLRRVFHFTIQRVLHLAAGACVGCVRSGLHDLHCIHSAPTCMRQAP